MIKHAKDFTLWAYDVGKGLVPETHFKINPEDGELRTYGKQRHQDCILPLIPSNGRVSQVGTINENTALFQLNQPLARQTEKAETSNTLRQ